MSTTAPDPRRWKALILVCAAIFVVVLDIAIVNVALPSIGKDLHFAEKNLQWVITAYALTYGGFLLLGGRAADLLGRRLIFMGGLALFAVASLVCGLSTSSTMLITARGVHGLGAAIVSPAALSIISTTFTEGSERNKALGAWGAVGGSGAAAGVLFGGILTKYLGWEWIFFVNVPVGVLVLLLTPFYVRESKREEVIHDYDVTGAEPVLVIGMFLLVVGGLWYTQIDVDGSYPVDLLPGFLAVGIGIPFAFIPMTIAALAGVSDEDAGLASGLINTSQQVGGAIGTAVLSTVAFTHERTLLHRGHPLDESLTRGFQWGFWVSAGIWAAGLLASFVLVRREEVAHPEAVELPATQS